MAPKCMHSRAADAEAFSKQMVLYSWQACQDTALAPVYTCPGTACVAPDARTPCAPCLSNHSVCCAGRVNGELKLHCHDAATWRFPSFSGSVACRGLDFHFWDAVDDLSSTDMDLVFDRQRVYMHNASGMFGSVPLTLSGGLACACGPLCIMPVRRSRGVGESTCGESQQGPGFRAPIPAPQLLNKP